MIYKINRNILIVAGLLIIISILLEVLYCTYIVSNFKYYGFTLNFNWFRYIEAKILFFLFLLLLTYIYSKSRFIYLVYVIVFVWSFIPNLILFSYMNVERSIICIIGIFLIFICFVSTIRFKLPQISLNKTSTFLVLFVLPLLLFIPVFFKYIHSINLQTLLLHDIYSTRAIFTKNLTFPVSYFYFWIIKVIAPIAIIYGFTHKKYLFALTGLFMMLFIFMVSGHKSVFFSIFIIVIFYLLGSTYEIKTKKILTYILMIILICPLVDLVFSTKIYESIVVQRIFFLPALLNHYYFQFFEHQPLYLSHSILSHFIKYPYSADPAIIIGETFFNKGNHANNGIISDGYMNFGIIGGVVWGFLVSLILAYFNSINIDKRYFGVIFIFILEILSSAFLTSILSSGMFLLIILSILVLKEK
ncbi:MAG: hypothetical protein HOO91_04850 [Bacteroidales bacterium]|nr:hypothetical protein [Bacteroidales bacterium]